MNSNATYSKFNQYGWMALGSLVVLASGVSIAFQIRQYGIGDAVVNQQVLLLVIVTVLIQDFVGKCRDRRLEPSNNPTNDSR